MIDFFTGDLSTFDLRKFYPDHSDDFRTRKEKRTEFYFNNVYGNKLVTCSACSGYRYYRGYACGCCEGTGKMRQR